ncbi:MAG: hypothetical protein L0332_20530 [Chloroflexi bacterium]|nr:hypothetical protein [Chloroflexota bacterium]MCI0729085.1 hypothetical protein [Chloroflexota bacterium]
MTQPTPSKTRPPREMLQAERPWSVKILTLLLFLQAAGFVAISVTSANPINFAELTTPTLFITTVAQTLTRTIAFSALALLAAMAGLGFLGLWRTGWPNAMLVQGLSLLLTLILYFREGPVYIYGLMLYSILMVVYLHHPEVQEAFKTKLAVEAELEEKAA